MTKNHYSKFCLSFLIALFFCNLSFAQNITSKAVVSTGIINSEIQERLLQSQEETSFTTSLLDWKIDAAPCIMADYELAFSNKYFIGLNGLYTIPLSSGLMKDYDWLNVYSTGGKELTHFSQHKNSLDQFFNTELSLGTGINLTQRIQFIQYIFVQYSYLRFTSKNGYRQYGTTVSEQNGYSVYSPWSSDIQKKNLDGKIVSYETQDIFLGLGSKIVFNINDRISTELFAAIQPSVWNSTLDTHHRRNDKYVYFDFASKLDFDTSILLEYKLNKTSGIFTKFCFSYNDSNNAAVYQSEDKKDWEIILNPGKASERHLKFLIGYTYNYEK